VRPDGKRQDEDGPGDRDPPLKLPEYIWRMKTDILNKEGLVQILNPKFGFDKLGGLWGMKDFHKRLLTSVKLQGSGKNKPKAKARGTLLVSGPGMGKTTFIECLAHEISAGAVMMDFGSMLGGHVGDTEKTTRRAFAVVDAIAPREATAGYKALPKDVDAYGELVVPVMKKLGAGTKVRFLIVGWDEVEKALSGANAGHNAGLDSGVNSRQFEFVLRWLTTRKSRTFVVATANNAASLNAAFTRSGRFTATFYVEKPDREQKDEIWKIAVAKYGLEATGPVVVRHGKKFWQADPRRGGSAGMWVDDETAATTFASAGEATELMAALKVKGAVAFPKLPDDTDWTGAEVDDCCEKAYLLEKSIIDAAKHVVPVFKRDKEGQAILEEWARGATLSARTGELYGTEMQSVGAGSQFGGRVKRTVKRAAPAAPVPAAEADEDDDE
jgi:SpoVK/Ycf46/Vps4 family AAA+-type ATPase